MKKFQIELTQTQLITLKETLASHRDLMTRHMEKSGKDWRVEIMMIQSVLDAVKETAFEIN